MSNKRKTGGNVAAQTPAKMAKKDQQEFNGTVFKSMLMDPTTVTKGLDTFVKMSKKLPCRNVYDVVEGYIRISAECAEILKLLEEENKVESKMLLVLQSLEVILLRIASDLSHFSVVGSTIVKKVASTHMKLMQTFMLSENSRFVRQCLTFMAAMVSQGPESARDVFSQLYFSKPLSGLAQRRDKMGRPDVRMAYVQFAVSFLLSGDNSTIGQLLETKDFLPAILSTGIKEDRISTVNLLLATLQSKVVQNKAISKTQKVRFFTAAILSHISSLYRWNGIMDSEVEASEALSSEEAGKMIVREQVHGFLLDLCCSRKHGISFHDPSLGTAGRAGNIVLLQFLVGLKDASKDEMLVELVVKTLKSSPDVLARYLKESVHSFTPRPKSAWQDNMTLLKRIYEAQPEVSKAFHSRELIPLPRLLTMVMVTSLPPVCNKAFFTQGLNCKNTVVQHTTLNMASFILKRALKNIEHCQAKQLWESSDIYNPAMMEEFVQLYREALSKVLPDMTSIVYQWQMLSKKEKGEGDGAKVNASEKTEEREETLTEGGDESQVVLLKAVILQVMCLYQRVVPHLVSQSRFDFSKLLKGIMSEKGVKEEVPPILQYQILQLALELPASKFSWFRIQDTSECETSGGERSVFYLLLKMFSSCQTTHLKTSTKMLVLKVLRDSGVFEHTWRELELWLNHLACLPPSQQEPVIQFLDKVLVKLLCNPHVYADKAAGLVQEAAHLQASLSGQDTDAVSIPISHIDDVLDMVDVIMEGSEGEMEQLGPSLTDDLIMQSFPFSAVVPAALEARNNLPATYKDEKGVLYEYLSAVLCDVLHYQREPLALCLTMQQYDKELHSCAGADGTPHASLVDFHSYYSRWLPLQAREALFSPSVTVTAAPSPSVGLSALLRDAYGRGPTALVRDALVPSAIEALASLELPHFPTVVCQLLLYIKTTVETLSTLPKGTGVCVVASLMEVLQAVVIKMQSVEPEVPKAAESQRGGELFLEVSQEEGQSKDQVLLIVLKSIFKHPCLEQWFLALERGTLPLHSLNPVQLKSLCSQLSRSIFSLLKATMDSLTRLQALDLIADYLSAGQQALMRELEEVARKPEGKRCVENPTLALEALLAFHQHMEVEALKEVVSALLLLPQESLVVATVVHGDGSSDDVTMEEAESQLSVYGTAALQVLTENPSQDGTLYLSRAHLCGLATLLMSCHSPTLEDFFLKALTSDPGSAKLVKTDVLLYCSRPAGGSNKTPLWTVGSLLLQNSATHRLYFELWCLEAKGLAEEACQSQGILTLLSAYLKMAAKDDPSNPPEVHESVLGHLKSSLLSPLWGAMLASEPGEGLLLLVEVLQSLIQLAAHASDVLPLLHDLSASLQKPQTSERWQLADAITEKLESNQELLDSWRKSQLSAALRWLAATYSSCKEMDAARFDEEEAVLCRLEQLMRLSPEHLATSDWNSFAKSGLKYRYKHHALLSTLTSLVELLYGTSESPSKAPPKGLLPAATLHMMLTSHSLFLPSMLGTEEESRSSPQAKEALISLSLALVRSCPSVCEMRHFVVLLGAYGARLSTADQKLLLLLQEYEKSGLSLMDFQCLLWGPAAVDHLKRRKSMGPSLWQQPSSEELLALLDPNRMLHTLTHFPQQRRILPQDGKELIYKQDGPDDLSDLYDPCFLLPLFSAILRPEVVTDCLKFVSSHALGFTVASLSSYDPKLRAAAYQVLGSYCQQLEGARFREKRQLQYLLDTVRNGIKQQNLRVPFILTTYIAKVAQQMLMPEEHMYMVINKFLLGHQSIDFKRVPEFFKLFYSSDLEYKVEREWMLTVLVEGLADSHCYELCEQQGLFHSLLGFGCSPLCDNPTQILILNVLKKTAHVTKGAYNLTKAYGLLTWLLQLLEKRFVEPRLLSTIVELTHTLWFTNLGQKASHAEGAKSNTEEQGRPSPPVKCLPLPLINEFFCLLLGITKHLRSSGLTAAQLSSFLQTLASVLMHHGIALGVHSEAGWITLKPPQLSEVDVLLLLICWATLARDAALLSSMQDLASSRQLHDFLSVGRERSRAKGFKAPQSLHTPEEEQTEADRESERNNQSLIHECKGHLRNIFTYWEPLPQTNLTPPKTGQDVPSTQVCEPQCPSHLTVTLLVKWALRTLATTSDDNNRSVLSFLKWMQKVALPHKEITNSLMTDVTVKMDLLRLYHQTCDCGNSDDGLYRAESLRLFTSIMLKMLEVHGSSLGPSHQTVITACGRTSTDDLETKDAGLSLLALYIHERWSGMESSEMFLSHIKLVLSKQQHKTESRSAIIDICTDIINSIDGNMSM